MNVFIFRRDLRWEDNSALFKLASETSEPILPIFIFNHKQLTSKFASDRAIEFMISAIKELSIHVFYDDDIATLKRINKISPIKTIGFNLDYTPFARKRDAAIIEWAAANKIHVITAEDYSLLPLDREWRVFTPYYKHCLELLNSATITITKAIPKSRLISLRNSKFVIETSREALRRFTTRSVAPLQHADRRDGLSR